MASITVKFENEDVIELFEELQRRYFQQMADKSTTPEAKQKTDAKKEPAPAPAPAPKATTEEITLEQVRAVLAKLTKANKQPFVKSLLNEYGAKKLTDVKEEDYPEILKRAEAETNG
jgi:hypothetical protein